MSFLAFILIFASTVLHASWNLLAKKNTMTVPFYTVICASACICWLHVQFWTPIRVMSLPISFWLLLAASIASDLIYCLGLLGTYKYLEMSTAYPVMRSLPILLTVLLTACLGLGDKLTPTALFGMVVVFAGCLLMPLNRIEDFSVKNYLNKKMGFVLLAACGTTGYTLCDKQVTKVLEETLPQIPAAIRTMTYYSTRTITLTSTLLVIIAATPKNRTILANYVRNRDWSPVLAGLFASATYILVLYAMNFVTNVSYVQVFRQLGLPIGMALGIIILKEKCTATKLAGIVLILAGLVLTVL